MPTVILACDDGGNVTSDSCRSPMASRWCSGKPSALEFARRHKDCRVFATPRLLASSPVKRGRGTMRSMVEGGACCAILTIRSRRFVSAQSIQREGERCKAPSPALRAVPLPRCAGEDEEAPLIRDQPKRQSAKASVGQSVSQSAAAYWPTRSDALGRLLAASGGDPEATVGSGGLSRLLTTTRRVTSPSRKTFRNSG